ncbi:MAG: M48 family metallopeptidase [Pseudomonadota bacterium]
MAQQAAPDWPLRLRADLARVAALEWRLRDAAGNSCPARISDAGLAIDDRRAYARRDWPLLQSSAGLGELPVVVGVATGGPAERAGLRPGDELVSINSEAVDAVVARRGAGALAADALLDEIGAAQAGSDVAVEVRRGGVSMTLSLQPVRHCAIRLVLFTDRGVDAHSDTRNVAMSTGMLAFARTDDELALAAGHEFAHVINGDRRGGGMAKRRNMEDAADERGFRLMGCAGFDAARGLTLFERLGANDWLGFLRAPTHRSWKDRIARLRALPEAGPCPATKV